MRILKYVIIAAAISFLTSGMIGCDKGGKLASITVTPAETMIAKGSNQQFTATATFSDGTTVNWTSAVTWSSDNAEVNISNDFGSYGLATALGTAPTGSITITATDVVNNISGSAVFSFADPVSISIKPANPYMSINTSYQFKAEALMPDDTTQDITSYVTWTTNDSSIAVVDSSTLGLVETQETAGATDIKITYSSASVSSDGIGTTIDSNTLLTVNESALNALTITDPASITVGDTVQFTVTGTLGDSTEISITASSLDWTSSNTDVASFNTEAGSEWLITAIAAGTTTITATDPITGTTSGSFELIVE